jgi:hypothetical protein
VGEWSEEGKITRAIEDIKKGVEIEERHNLFFPQHICLAGESKFTLL